ncbi:hypothetical protein CKO11_09690 [Rhodobacter sp. TJ_12]|uniref:hypothetical protein n=1 Tax=Rhodobacter sp. TJ_12 TaxID=2029399 RepID=UPI001CBE1A58|nr:hypothetical protein [Rhodobacter sp. TJ_12]MBZ4022729.1 hypothetical protein [Rhodobacter sp. TJ_12]
MQGIFVLVIVGILGKAMKAPPKVIGIIMALIWAGFTAGHAFLDDPEAPLRAISGGSLTLWLAVGAVGVLGFGAWTMLRKRG